MTHVTTTTTGAGTDVAQARGVMTPVSGIADPAPLGLAAFAMTTFILSVFNANIIKAGPGHLDYTVLPVALFYGGIVQLLAGMWEFRRNNTFGAVAFSSFGAFWLAFAGLTRYVVANRLATGGDLYQALGLFLLVWAIFTAYMTVAALHTNAVVFAVFVALTLTFVFLAIGAFQNTATINTWTKVGGWAGLVTAVIAWYGSFAGVTNATWGRTVLPMWPAVRYDSSRL